MDSNFRQTPLAILSNTGLKPPSLRALGEVPNVSPAVPVRCESVKAGETQSSASAQS
jgi:hypothetical protein